MDQVNESLRPVASFVVENTSSEAKRLALFAGHYNVDEILFNAENRPFLSHANPSALVAAGYQCDQVADDYNAEVDTYPIKVVGKSKRTRMIDFVNYVKSSGLNVTKIRITDFSSDSNHELFNHEIEVSQSAVSAKGGSDYIQMSTYVNPRNYQQNVIEIDLESQKLLLDETTVVIMDVVAKAKFQIDLILG